MKSEDWLIRCETCSYGARFGALQFSAEQACVRHRMRHSHHRIGLYRRQYVFGELDGQTTIDDIPPF